MKDTSIELSDWSKEYVKDDAEVGYSYNFGDSDSMRARNRCKNVVYFVLAATFISACVGIIVAVNKGLISLPEGEGDPGEEIVEMKNCSLEHHIEWYSTPITKQDGQQYTVTEQIAHDPTSFT